MWAYNFVFSYKDTAMFMCTKISEFQKIDLV